MHEALTKKASAAVLGACWPDPDPVPLSGPRADDVTRMNSATALKQKAFSGLVRE